MEPRQLITAKQQAKLLAVTPRTLRAWVAAGIVPAIKLPGCKFSNGNHQIDRGTVRFDPLAVAESLNKYTVNTPRQHKRRAGVVADSTPA
jgi:hypothetical protein